MNAIPYINKGSCGLLFLSEIYYIECSYRKAEFHTESGTYFMYISPDGLSRYLDSRFNRCLSTMMINFEKVRGMKGCNVLFINGEELRLSRNCYLRVRKDYVEYLRKLQKTLANHGIL